MKPSRSSRLSAKLPLSTLVITLLGLALFIGVNARASSGADHLDDAVSASQAWIAEIDNGKYDESYSYGSEAMQQKAEENRWVHILTALREPWGDVLSRKQLSHIYKPNGFEGAEGEFMVVTYDTSFKQLDSATEVVVMQWQDGRWRGAGYNAGPKSTDVSATPLAPASQTEIHTDPHVQAQPQTPQ